MKILILTGHDGVPYGPIAEASYREYASRHGYWFQCAKLLPASEGRGHPAWQKLALVENAIIANFGGWVLWVDADSLVTNHKLPISDETTMRSDWMLVSRDWSDGESPWSSGVMLIRACDEALVFFAVAQEHAQWRDAGCFDQSAMHQVCRERPKLAEGINILPRRVLQSVPREVSDGVVDPWKPGDFIAHFTAMEAPRRVELMTRYAAQHVIR